MIKIKTENENEKNESNKKSLLKSNNSINNKNKISNKNNENTDISKIDLYNQVRINNSYEESDKFITICGKIPNQHLNKLREYDISDPNSEVMLKYCIWEDYRQKNSYQNCIVKDSDYYLSQTKQHSFEDLKNAIKKFTSSSKEYNWHLTQMENNYKKVQVKNFTIEEKKGCALVLSYYTGFKDNSDRSSRNTNAVIRGMNSFKKTEKWYDGKEFFTIIYYISKAISNLPLYWGYTVRCVQLTDEQI